jgi:hypothetical protein
MKTIHHVVDTDCGQDAVWTALTDRDRDRLGADDYCGVYNVNWGYYLESLRLLCVDGAGKPFRPTGAY